MGPSANDRPERPDHGRHDDGSDTGDQEEEHRHAAYGKQGQVLEESRNHEPHAVPAPWRRQWDLGAWQSASKARDPGFGFPSSTWTAAWRCQHTPWLRRSGAINAGSVCGR